MRRILAAILVPAAFLAAAIVGAAPASASSSNPAVQAAAGCGTDLSVGFDSTVLLFPGNSKTYDNVNFVCVTNLSELDFGFFVIPIGGAGGVSGKISVKVTNTGTILPNFSVALVNSGYAQACLPFGFGIQVVGSNPNRASFQCLALRQNLVNGSPDPNQFLPQLVVPTFGLTAGSGSNLGSVNIDFGPQLQPLRIDGTLGDLLNPILLPIIQRIFPGPLTSAVSVTVG